MRALDAKQDTPASSTGLIIEPKKGEENESSVSFSSLLKGLDTKEDELGIVLKISKGEQKESLTSEEKKSSKKSFIDLLAKTTKTEIKSGNVVNLEQIISQDTDDEELRSLLNGEFQEIDSEITKNLSVTELKMLAQDAKTYLKNQILSSEGFKRSEIDSLPKTLKGLTQAAQKLGIDLSKITFEEVQTSKTTASLTKEQKKEQQTLKNNPIFKTQNSTEISTQQIVQSKSHNMKNLEMTHSSDRAEDTLELLLQGKKVSQKTDRKLTSDFSVETAKVIASAPKGDSVKSLETLLQPTLQKSDENSEPLLETKVTTNVAKADSFEVKLNEAKQMVKYLSQDVKQAIDDYKSPFTRVKVQLNPQQLGEIELTVVQRGKNLHVNLSSNNAAINTLAMNANDLKVQLQNSGINNASLNFSNNSQGGDAANGGQSNPQQQNRQQAQAEYNYFDQEETNEELLSSLEIVVPYYA